jgi:hypothetical protein
LIGLAFNPLFIAQIVLVYRGFHAQNVGVKPVFDERK